MTTTNDAKALAEAKRIHNLDLDGERLAHKGTLIGIDAVLQRIPYMTQSLTPQRKPGWDSALRWELGRVTEIWFDESRPADYRRFALAAAIGHGLLHTPDSGEGDQVWTLDLADAGGEAGEAAVFAIHLLAPLNTVETLIASGISPRTIASDLAVPYEVIQHQLLLLNSLNNP